MPGWVYAIIAIVICAGLVFAGYYFVDRYNQKNMQSIQFGNFGDAVTATPKKSCNTCGCGR